MNVVCPGVVDTPMARAVAPDDATLATFAAEAPMARAGRPEEIAAAAVWLLIDESSFVTGEALVVDGRALAR